MTADTFETWDELAPYLRSMSKLPQDTIHSPTGHTAIRFAYPYEGDEIGVFFIHNARDNGREWVYVGVRVLPANMFDLDALSGEFSRQRIGALGLARDYIVIGHNLPIPGLRTDHITQTVHAMCSLANWCKERSQPAPQDGAAFAYLVE